MEQVYQPHPAALKMPPMSAEEYEELRDDIAKNGLLDPITLCDEQILDGIHRDRACRETGTEERYDVYLGDDPLGFVLSKNVRRRSLSQKQKRALAKEYVLAHAELSNRALAEPAGVSDKTVADIREEIAAEAHEAAAMANVDVPHKDDEEAAWNRAGFPPELPPPAPERVEKTLKKDGTPRKARGRKPGQKVAARAPKEIKPKPIVNDRDQWVASSGAIFSKGAGDAIHAIVAIVGDHASQIQAKVSETQRRELVKKFAEALGLKLVT